MAEQGTWNTVLTTLTRCSGCAVGLIDSSVSVDSTIAHAHQYATNITRHTGGWIELQGILVKSPPITASGALAAG